MSQIQKPPPAQTNNNVAFFGYGMAIGAAILFSTKPIIIKYAYSLGIDSLTLMLLRMLTAIPIYLIIGVLLVKKSSLDLSQTNQKILLFKAMTVGLLGYYLASFLDLAGLEYVNAQLERMLLYAYPTFVAIFAFIIFKQPISKQQKLALAICYAGIILLFAKDFSLQGDQVITGSVLILLSAVSYALYLLLSKPFIHSYGSLLFTCISMLSASVATVVHYSIDMVFTGTEITAISDYSLELWGAILGLTIFATVIPTFMISEAVKQIGATNTSLTGTLGPVVTTIFAVLLLGEIFTWVHAVGMILIVGAILLLSRTKK